MTVEDLIPENRSHHRGRDGVEGHVELTPEEMAALYNEEEGYCGAVICGAGRECSREEGVLPTCICKPHCPDHFK